MKKRLRTAVVAFALLLPALALLLAMPAFAAQAQYHQARYQLKVDGLACPFCAYGIEKKLTHTDGVKDVAVDINSGIVTVTMAEGATLTQDRARKIVKDAGFSLRNFGKAQADADR